MVSDVFEVKRHKIGETEYNHLISLLAKKLEKRREIVFSYLHGSFLNRNNFGDIDIAVYVQGLPENKYLDYEFNLNGLLGKMTSLPVDVRVLNNAPYSFRYSVIKNGVKLVDKDEDMRVSFETETFKIYFDFLPFRRRYLKEVLFHEI